MNLAQNVCHDDFRLSLKLGHLESKTSSLGQSKKDIVNTIEVTVFEAIIINFAQNICLDNF